MTGQAGTLGATLPRRRLGRSELQVPSLALGGAGLGGVFGGAEEEAAIDTVHYALSRGIDFIDTSPYYRESERRIGLALRDHPRQEFILSTKAGTHPDRFQDYSRDAILWSVDNSLRLLGTDYLDLVMVHDPSDMASVMEPGGALDALEELREQGVVRAVGVGLRELEFHRIAIESGRVDVILTFCAYNLLNTSAVDWLLPLAARHDVGVLNGAVLLFGLLAGDPIQLEEKPWFLAPDLNAARQLYSWSAARDIPLQALALQYSLRQPLVHCTLTGAKTKTELEENLRAATYPIPEAMWKEFEDLVTTLH